MDLLKKLLTPEPEARISATSAERHPYFKTDESDKEELLFAL